MYIIITAKRDDAFFTETGITTLYFSDADKICKNLSHENKNNIYVIVYKSK